MPHRYHRGPGAPQWCGGFMDVLAQSLDPRPIQQGLLWPYVKSLSSYKCPADPKRVSERRADPPQCEHEWMVEPGRLPICSAFWAGTRVPHAVRHQRGDVAVHVLDSHGRKRPDHQRRNFVGVLQPSGPNGTTWIDVPASYHNQGAGMVYADGHTQIRKWRDSRLLTATALFTPAVPPYDDLIWLRERTTAVPESRPKACSIEPFDDDVWLRSRMRASVLECGSPLPLSHHSFQSARRLAHSRTLARRSLALCASAPFAAKKKSFSVRFPQKTGLRFRPTSLNLSHVRQGVFFRC